MGQFFLLLLLTNNLCQQASAGNRQYLSTEAEKLPFILQGVDSPVLEQRIRQVSIQAWTDVENLLGGVRLHPARPLTLEITFTKEHRFFPCLFRKQAPAGILHVAENRAVLCLNPEFDLRSQQIIRHEIAHWLLRQYWLQNFTDENGVSAFALPAWLDEGIACLLEIPLTEDGQTQTHPERCRQFLQLAKRRKCEVRFERFLMPERSKTRFSSNEYAFSWALIFYLSRHYPTPNRSALQILLQSAPRNPPDLEHWHYHEWLQIVNPPVNSPDELLRQIQTWLQQQPLISPPPKKFF